MSYTIDLDALPYGETSRALALGTDFLTAVTRAAGESAVTYVIHQGQVVAAVSPPEAAERYEHAGKAEASPGAWEETVPVLVRAGPRRRRWLGPFEGIF
jgi:hypothetical protein